MPRRKPGYHDMTVQVPDAIWQALVEASERENRSVSYLVNQMLGEQFNVPVPRTKGPGRPPKKKGDS